MISDVITNIIAGIEQVKRDKDKIVLDAVKANESAIIDLLTEDQLSGKGIDSDSRAIEPPYTPFTKRLKRFKRQTTDFVTLKDTGSFHDSINIKYATNSFSFNATDSKKNKLLSKYGTSVLGLTDDNILETADIIRDDVTAIINDIILTNAKL